MKIRVVPSSTPLNQETLDMVYKSGGRLISIIRQEFKPFFLNYIEYPDNINLDK